MTSANASHFFFVIKKGPLCPTTTLSKKESGHRAPWREGTNGEVGLIW